MLFVQKYKFELMVFHQLRAHGLLYYGWLGSHLVDVQLAGLLVVKHFVGIKLVHLSECFSCTTCSDRRDLMVILWMVGLLLVKHLVGVQLADCLCPETYKACYYILEFGIPGALALSRTRAWCFLTRRVGACSHTLVEKEALVPVGN
jgi:hypothetical protein